MTRTISELRQAARDAGWDGDRLAAEILGVLSETEIKLAEKSRLEAELERARTDIAELKRHASAMPTAKTPVWAWLAVAVALGASAVAVSIHLNAKSAVNLRDQEFARLTTSHEAEVARLKALSSEQLGNAAKQIEAALKTADALAQNTAFTADSNQATTRLLMDQWKELQEEVRRLREQTSAPTKTPGPATQTPNQPRP